MHAQNKLHWVNMYGIIISSFWYCSHLQHCEYLIMPFLKYNRSQGALGICSENVWTIAVWEDWEDSSAEYQKIRKQRGSRDTWNDE